MLDITFLLTTMQLKQVEEEQEALEDHTPLQSLFEEFLQLFRVEVAKMAAQASPQGTGVFAVLRQGGMWELMSSA